MASNQTEHYRLSQWEATDRILREDFNADNRKIDAAIAGRVVVGTYTGKAGTQKITLGFRPKAVGIAYDITFASSTTALGNVYLTADGVEIDRITYEDDGFSLPGDEQGYRPSVNQPGHGYTYVAFR